MAGGCWRRREAAALGGVAGLAEGQPDTNPTPAHRFCFSASAISSGDSRPFFTSFKDISTHLSKKIALRNVDQDMMQWKVFQSSLLKNKVTPTATFPAPRRRSEHFWFHCYLQDSFLRLSLGYIFVLTFWGLFRV